MSDHCHSCTDSHADSTTDDSTTVINTDVSPTHTTTLMVDGVDCADEVAAIVAALKSTQHVTDVKVSIVTGKTVIRHDNTLTPSDLISTLKSSSLRSRIEGTEAAETTWLQRNGHLVSVITSGTFLTLGLLLEFLFEIPDSSIPTLKILYTISIIAGAWFITPKAWRAVRHGRYDMNLLMTVAVVGAVIIGQWSEAAAVAFLFALSELLESFSVSRARRAIESLLDLSPSTAWVKKEGEYRELEVSSIHPGDTIRIKSGERVPLDGTVTSGSSSINQAPITGESMPVEKSPNDPVFAGTINGNGTLEVSVTGEASETLLAGMVRLIESAQSQKSPTERFVDTFAKYYTPTVMVIALLVCLIPGFITGDWSTWFYRSLVLLVIACPCALVIATPVSIVSGLTAMARRGVLIKGGAHLEALGKINALAVDKTGTITSGEPTVSETVTLTDMPAEEIIRIAAAIDTHSTHPIAEAINRWADQKNISYAAAENYASHTGLGASGDIDGHSYFVGNHRYAHQIGNCNPDVEAALHKIESQGLSVAIVGHMPHDDCPGEILGILAVGDTIRPEATAAIQALHRAGVKNIVMLSGDNQTTVDAIAKQAGIDSAHGDLLPEDKLTRIQEMQALYGNVAMIGDGVNDAPAMAASSLGIAMGIAGSDTAIESADMTLMTDDLSKVAEAITLGRRTLRIIKTNIAFALGIKALILILAIIGITSLWLAILADTGATLIVIANALRLLKSSS